MNNNQNSNNENNDAGQWFFYDFEVRNKLRNVPVEERDINDLCIIYASVNPNVQADFDIVWHYFSGKPAPQIRVFEDSWLALYRYGQEFLKLLAENDNKHLTKEQMKEKLLSIGFVDNSLIFD